MKLLLDTHVLLWWLDGDERLIPAARSLIADESNEILVSAASAWEISTKVRIGKLPGAVEVAAKLPQIIVSQGFVALSITIDHALRAGVLPGPHRDPFDRMLAAQAQAENIPIISKDAVFDTYAVVRLWETPMPIGAPGLG